MNLFEGKEWNYSFHQWSNHIRKVGAIMGPLLYLRNKWYSFDYYNMVIVKPAPGNDNACT